MATYSQANRLISVNTPLGSDVLLLEGYKGSEYLSKLFRYELDMLATFDANVAFDQILGQSVTVTVLLPDGSSRYLNGIVSRFTQGESVPGPDGDETFIRYRAELVPTLWILTKNFQSRIFQQMSVPDILKEVLTSLNVDYQIQGTFKTRDYCVQYRESDFAFASRLMEEEGIYYYFKHSDGSHQMVVANTPQSHDDVPGPTTLIYDEQTGGNKPDDRVYHWSKSQEIRSGKVTLWDHCFELPGQNLEAEEPILETVAAGTVTHKIKVGPTDQLEQYDYPGEYAKRFDGIDPGGGDRASDVQNIFQDNTRTTGIRMDEEAATVVEIAGQSTCRHLLAGAKFSLDRHFNADGEYVLVEVRQAFGLKGAYSTGGSDYEYDNHFRCIPAALPFAPARTTPKPTVKGTQSAVVVGPSGEEIFTDKYSRVKVQFPWDRQGQLDADSSCWIRVGTLWAGKQWGVIHIPRIGQEVIVAFEEGDPDQPIIVGSVYNAEQMPPYALPDNRTQSGIQSRSSLSGTADNFNELRFEDKKDEEEIYFHAEKNFNRVVENNDTLKVGFDKKDKGDQGIEIFNNRSIAVGCAEADDGSESKSIFNNRSLTIGCAEADDGSETIDVWNNRTETIQEGNETVTIAKGSRTHSIKTDDTLTIEGKNTVNVTGDQAITIKSGNHSLNVSAGTSTIEAATSITLKVGGNSITIDASGITIKGAMVTTEANSANTVKGATVTVQSSGPLSATGSPISIG